MKAHKLFRAGAAMALIGAFAGAQEQQNGFFAGFKLRTATQMASREDNLMPIYLGCGIDLGYQFDFGRLSAELGYKYKAGRQYLDDLTKREVPSGSKIDFDESTDSRKNQFDGLTLRLSYERPFGWFSARGGLQLASFKFRQEYIAYVEFDPWAFASYYGVIDNGSLSISPFIGVSMPVATNYFVELNLVGLNYKAVDYTHVMGEVNNVGGQLNDADYPKYTTRFMPHAELTFGFRF